MRARLLVLLLVLAAALAGCGGSDDGETASSEGGGGPKPFLGVSPGLPLLADPKTFEREIEVMADAGVTTLRVPLNWRELEPARGELRLDGADRIVAAAAENGLEFLPVVFATPRWAAAKPGDLASPPRAPADYGRFLTALIERYGPEGSLWKEREDIPKRPVRAWQVWNEPSHDYYWSTRPWAPSYVELLRAARRAVHGADPGGKVVMAGFPDRSWDSLAEVERAGGHGAFDIAAVHPYTAEVQNVVRVVELARAALRRGGDGKTPMWLTEVAWTSAQGKARNPFGFETTERGQARKLAEAIPLLARRRSELGIGRIYWETWASGDRDASTTWDWAGLRRVRGDTVEPKPAFAAFRRVARKLADR